MSLSYRAISAITELQQNLLGFVEVVAVLQNLHCVYSCWVRQIHPDPVLRGISVCDPGTCLWILPAVYSSDTRRQFSASCTRSPVPVQRDVDAVPYTKTITITDRTNIAFIKLLNSPERELILDILDTESEHNKCHFPQDGQAVKFKTLCVYYL